MPHSGPEFQEMLRGIVRSISPTTVLDIGVGAGKTGQICRSVCPNASVVGVEACGDYRKQFANEWETYAKVEIGDALAWSLSHSGDRFDLTVFGDVLEHMWVENAMGSLRFWSDRSKFVVAVWPNGYPQDAHGGVKSEIHRCEIRLQDMVLSGLDVVRYHKHYRVFPHSSKSLAVIRGRIPSESQAGIAY